MPDCGIFRSRAFFCYTTSRTVSRNVCPFSRRIKRTFSLSVRSHTKKSAKIAFISLKRLSASVLKFFSAFLICSCSIVIYVLLLFFRFAARFALRNYSIASELKECKHISTV